ncbi:hypothetical protein Bca4012_005810 [Brassica carinata]
MVTRDGVEKVTARHLGSAARASRMAIGGGASSAVRRRWHETGGGRRQGYLGFPFVGPFALGPGPGCYTKKLSGLSNSGTTHSKNHLMRCLERTNHYMSQLLTPKRKKKENPATVATISLNEGQPKTVTLGLSLIRSNIVTRLLLRMIILHGFPLPMVDHVAFKVFSRNLQPYELGKINLSVEMWSSRDNANYMCLASHHIDEEWRLQRNVVNFITLDPSRMDDMLLEVIIRYYASPWINLQSRKTTLNLYFRLTIHIS